jgi:hypothetical protein
VTGDLLGGRLHVGAIDIDQHAWVAVFDLELEALQLGEVLLLHGEDVRGSGVIDARIPLRIDAGGISASQGRAITRPPGGEIRYAAAAQGLFAGQPGLDFALRALGDFTYSRLEADVDYAPDGTLVLAVRLLGHNPSIESGRPIQYNLNLTQNVHELLQSLQISARLTDQIEHHLRRP